MYLNKFNPINNSSRLKTRIVSHGTSNFKFKRLTIGKVLNSGRNLNGQVVIRSRGSSVKNNFYFIDYFRKWSNKIAVSVNLKKQSNNSTLLSLIKYSNGTFSYILASAKLIPGSITFSTIRPSIFVIKNTDFSCNILLKYVDYTLVFFNIELIVGSGGKYSRSAGTFCKVVAFNLEKNIVKIVLPSGLTKIISPYCMITLGRASNILHKKEFFTKAGYYRNLGFKSKVRGVAMNPIDHPHGGRTKTNSPELTPWGKIAKFNK